ncbi:hypothetical protein [Allorhizocola rhizosphaerae]|uniref:hypothetical protein n=1 Tax=Allorhizocola rhizosphaerae TaxID=1872709 RepID=UPI000E3DDEBE|nr:hypothetical protein [Allorhizocola rhizosphaerae]
MNTIGALPPDRAAASLTRVWKRLSECFEAELKLAGPHGATPLRTVIEEDFPLKKELDFADTVSVCDDDEVVRPVALSTLDAVDPDSARAGDTLSGIALDLIKQLRDNMIGRLTGALLSRARPDCVGLPWPQTRDAWHSQIVTATGGENAVVWVDESIFETANGVERKDPHVEGQMHRTRRCRAPPGARPALPAGLTPHRPRRDVAAHPGPRLFAGQRQGRSALLVPLPPLHRRTRRAHAALVDVARG